MLMVMVSEVVKGVDLLLVVALMYPLLTGHSPVVCVDGFSME